MKNKYLEKVALLGMLGGFQGAKKEDKIGGTFLGGPLGGFGGAVLGGLATGVPTALAIGSHHPAVKTAIIIGATPGAYLGGLYGGKLYSKVKDNILERKAVEDATVG